MNMEPAAKIPTALNSTTNQIGQGNLMLFGQCHLEAGLTYRIFKTVCTLGQVVPKQPIFYYFKYDF